MQKSSGTRRRGAHAIVLWGALAGALILLTAALTRCGATPEGKLKGNTARVEYLAALGWEVETVPLSEQKILLPETFPDVLAEYNELQKQQGFDLEKYAGKEAVLYTYRVLNYPTADDVQCCLYIYRSRVIGGDVHSTSYSGFMMGLR